MEQIPLGHMETTRARNHHLRDEGGHQARAPTVLSRHEIEGHHRVNNPALGLEIENTPRMEVPVHRLRNYLGTTMTTRRPGVRGRQITTMVLECQKFLVWMESVLRIFSHRLLKILDWYQGGPWNILPQDKLEDQSQTLRLLPPHFCQELWILQKLVDQNLAWKNVPCPKRRL